jgi:hypothetical protein
VPCQDEAHPDPNTYVHVLNLVTLEDHRHGRVERFENANGGLSVSPDGQMILYTRLVGRGADLMSIHNFR